MLAYVLARVTAPFAFITRRRTARHLFGFALAEHESMLELRAAAARTASPERRALYLQHALDEARHATTFAAHANDIRHTLGLPGFAAPRTDCEGLYDKLGETRFLAFVHLGERRGRMQFEAYRALFEGRGDAKLRAMFHALIGDEKGHESYSRAQLVLCAGGEPSARRVLARMRAWEAWRAWRRNGAGLAGVVYLAAMFVLYVALFPLAIAVRLSSRGRSAPGWRGA